MFSVRPVPAGRAVPPGRIAYDLNADVLLLHTIQAEAVVEELQRTGTFVPDAEYVSTLWPEAYGWMQRMMAARVTTTGERAVWLWAKIRRRDLVSLCRRASLDAEPQVLLTCRIPRRRVLISHFDEWHSALNGWLSVTPHPDETHDAFEARFDHLVADFRARLDAAGADQMDLATWPADLRAEAEHSWEQMFDPSLYGRTSCWQATVHDLRAVDVVDAVALRPEGRGSRMTP